MPLSALGSQPSALSPQLTHSLGIMVTGIADALNLFGGRPGSLFRIKNVKDFCKELGNSITRLQIVVHGQGVRLKYSYNTTLLAILECLEYLIFEDPAHRAFFANLPFVIEIIEVNVSGVVDCACVRCNEEADFTLAIQDKCDDVVIMCMMAQNASQGIPVRVYSGDHYRGPEAQFLFGQGQRIMKVDGCSRHVELELCSKSSNSSVVETSNMVLFDNENCMQCPLGSVRDLSRVARYKWVNHCLVAFDEDLELSMALEESRNTMRAEMLEGRRLGVTPMEIDA
jgi:hypothetical protein